MKKMHYLIKCIFDNLLNKKYAYKFPLKFTKNNEEKSE